MGMSNSYRLECALRQAVESWMGDAVSGPWDDILGLVATIMDNGEVSLGNAARLDFLLRETGDGRLTECPMCECPAAGMSHATVSTGCPDVRLHDPKHSPDGKCRYCR